MAFFNIPFFNKRTPKKFSELKSEKDLALWSELAESDLRFIGEQFFEAILPTLAKKINADMLIIGELNRSNAEIATCKVYLDGKIIQNFTYKLDGTPCGKVVGFKTCSYPINVYTLFPKDLILKEQGFEGYIGIPLFNGENDAIGIVAALFRQPIFEPKPIENTLNIVASRISAELEHIFIKRAFEKQHQELLLTRLELEQRNEDLVNTNKHLNELNKQVHESLNLKNAFLANLSHEVRTPMNVILGFSEIIKTMPYDSDERDSFVDIICDNGNQLLKIMDSLVDISKLQTRQVAEHCEWVDLDQIVQKANKRLLKEVKSSAKEIEVIVSAKHEDKQDFFYCDKTAITKILDHLLDNALKFTPSGHIKFGFEKTAGGVEFFVSDTGIGIPLELENKVFELFRQAETEHTREFGGTGIGLSIAIGFAEIMGGRIWLANKKEEKGTTFRVFIPAKREII